MDLFVSDVSRFYRYTKVQEGPIRTSTMEFFCKNRLPLVDYFLAKSPSQMFGCVRNETKYSRINQVKFVEDNL